MFLSKITSDFLTEQNPNEYIYERHQQVWSLFPSEPFKKERDFIYFFYKKAIYMVSQKKPLSPSEGEFEIQTKNYNPSLDLEVGRSLCFDVRLNAQICRNNKKISVMTAFANDLKRQGWESEFNWNFIAYEAIKTWFEKRIDTLGFSIIFHEIVSFHFNKLKKPGNSKIWFNSIDVKGFLKITNMELFLKSLYYGIGRSRAFGCGLILIAPLPKE